MGFILPSYILDWVQKIGLRLKVVGIGDVCVGTNSHASKSSILVSCHFHSIHNDLFGKHELQDWWIESGSRCKDWSGALERIHICSCSDVDCWIVDTHGHQQFIFRLKGWIVPSCLHHMRDLLLLQQTQIANSFHWDQKLRIVLCAALIELPILFLQTGFTSAGQGFLNSRGKFLSNVLVTTHRVPSGPP